MKEQPIKICPLPFVNLNPIAYDAEKDAFSNVPCCTDWLTEEYFKMDSKEGWNSEAFVEIRKRILKGDYSLCKRSYCNQDLMTIEELRDNPNVRQYHPIAMENLELMEQGEAVLAENPAKMTLAGEVRCNLACPSCRKDFILEVTPRQEKSLAKVESMLWENKETIEIVTFAGYSEVFFSPWSFNLLKQMTPQNFPKLRAIYVITNGLLLDQKKYDEIGEAAKFLKRISVSIDSGTEEIYQKVRGGSWRILNENLEWLAGMREAQKVDWTSINFVVRAENYKTMPEFVEMGHKYRVDSVTFRTFAPWGNMALDYEKEAVHLPEHPEHKAFLEVCRQVKRDPKVNLYVDGTENI